MHLHKILVLAFINTLITIPAGMDGRIGQTAGRTVTKLETLSVSL